MKQSDDLIYSRSGGAVWQLPDSIEKLDDGTAFLRAQTTPPLGSDLMFHMQERDRVGLTSVPRLAMLLATILIVALQNVQQSTVGKADQRSTRLIRVISAAPTRSTPSVIVNAHSTGVQPNATYGCSKQEDEEVEDSQRQLLSIEPLAVVDEEPEDARHAVPVAMVSTKTRVS